MLVNDFGGDLPVALLADVHPWRIAIVGSRIKIENDDGDMVATGTVERIFEDSGENPWITYRDDRDGSLESVLAAVAQEAAPHEVVHAVNEFIGFGLGDAAHRHMPAAMAPRQRA